MENLKLNENEKHTLKLRAQASGYESFRGLVTFLKREETTSDASAIQKARDLRGDLYHAWCVEGRPDL